LGFLLFACDQDFAVAEFSGLGAIDASAERNEKYLYSIFINDTSGQLHIDTGYYFIGLDDVPDVPIMDDVLRGRFSEHTVTLRWDIRFLKNYYSSYVIERSDNGRNFSPINDRPLVLLENPGTDPNEMVFVDSLPRRERNVFYRIRGKDAFGDLSEPSNVVQGRGQRALEVNPELLELKVERGRLNVSWDFDRGNEREVAHFEIRSREDRFGEDVVLQTRIAQRLRTITIPKPTRTCYITVVAVGNDGTEKPSLPMLFQEEDNTPPDAPVRLVATIDTNGVVLLHWRPNTEDDLSGYRVFRANQATAEFTQITSQEIKDTVFFDTVSMNTTTSVFYRVMAVDFRGNQSQLSAVCEAKRPMLFAPTAPVVVSYRLDGQSLFLRWANSADDGVTSTQILIAGADLQSVPNNWDILGTIRKTGDFDSSTFVLNHFGDVKIAAKSMTANLSSDFSNTVQFTVAPAPLVAPELFTTSNREQKTATLRWTIRPTESIERIQIFRNENGQPPVVIKNLSGNKTQFVDTNLEEGKTYEYRIRIETENGTASFSKKNMVKF
jgi:fibronectin type 3 domain-containing protein